MTKQAEVMRRLTAERRAAGLCIKCEKPYPGPYSACDECRQYAAAFKRLNYKMLKKDGLCVTCRTPTGGTQSYCTACLERARAWKKTRKERATNDT